MGVLDGRVALVTGGGTGIGRAVALDLAKGGAEVVICGRRQEPLDETVSVMGGGTAVTADLTNPESVESLAKHVLAEKGGIDILVNNAGFSSKIRSSRHIGAAEWRAVRTSGCGAGSRL